MVKPTAKQRAWQDLEYGLFVHFGINTFCDLEWSDGTVPATEFAPTALDPRQWAAAAKLAGMRYLVLTAKHHDGFCLWPTETTDYSVASSPWGKGGGDVVEQVAAACQEQGLKLGLYCSPWDRHEPCYADEKAYDRFYLRQWTELLTRYGEITEVWFDGAGSQDHQFDWDAIFENVYRHQPNAVCFNGPDVRWVGNEDGLAPENCWNVIETDAGLLYKPAECDVPLRKGWFWHPSPDESTRKSMAHLWDIHHRSIGHGTNLLLNIAPDRRGLIPEEDVRQVVNLKRLLDQAYGDDRAYLAETSCSGCFEGEAKSGPSNVIDGDGRTRWLADGVPAYVEVTLPQPTEIDRAVLQEWLDEGERVRRWRLLADGTEVARGEALGHKRIVRFPPTTAQRFRLVLDEADAAPGLRRFQLFRGIDPT